VHSGTDFADVDCMNLAFVWGGAAVLAAWAILALLGNERERKLRDFEANLPPKPIPEPEKQPSQGPAAAAPPQRKAA
jgi:hypothetical protein